MAENTKETIGSSTTTGKAGEGENVITSSSKTTAGGTASGNTPVAPPTDAKPGDAQAGTIGASDAEAGGKVEKAGYPVEITAENHEHNGKAVKVGETISVDMATYRWLLENKKGKPGNAENVGAAVSTDTETGETSIAETDEEAIARLEKEFATTAE